MELPYYFFKEILDLAALGWVVVSVVVGILSRFLKLKSGVIQGWVLPVICAVVLLVIGPASGGGGIPFFIILISASVITYHGRATVKKIEKES